MNTTRTIKPENWMTLADTLRTTFGQTINPTYIEQIRDGSPSEDAISAVSVRCERVAARALSANERAACLSILETLRNYGLISAPGTSATGGAA